MAVRLTKSFANEQQCATGWRWLGRHQFKCPAGKAKCFLVWMMLIVTMKSANRHCRQDCSWLCLWLLCIFCSWWAAVMDWNQQTTGKYCRVSYRYNSFFFPDQPATKQVQHRFQPHYMQEGTAVDTQASSTTDQVSDRCWWWQLAYRNAQRNRVAEPCCCTVVLLGTLVKWSIHQ